MTFAAPSNASESVKVADLAGHLLIITPTEYKTGIQTVHGLAEAVEVDIVDLDAGTTYGSVLWFNVALRNALKNKIGQKVLARIGQGAAKPGKSAPWILVDATSDANALAKANAFLNATVEQVVAHNTTVNYSVTPSVAPATPAATATGGITPEVAALLAQLGAKPV